MTFWIIFGAAMLVAVVARIIASASGDDSGGLY